MFLNPPIIDCNAFYMEERWLGKLWDAKGLASRPFPVRCPEYLLRYRAGICVATLSPGGEGSGEEAVEEAGVGLVLDVGPDDEGDEEADEFSLPVVQEEVFHGPCFGGGWRSTGSGVRRW